MADSHDSGAGEIWKPIPGYEGRYDVSNLGRVKSLRKQQRKNRWYPDRIMRPGVVHGYHQVSLRKDNQSFQRKVHQLVLEAFVGPRPTACGATRHLNGNRSDNRLENLAWGTFQENSDDMVAHGTTLTGTKHHKAKVTEDDVREIRRRRTAGATLKELVNEFGIGFSQVSNIARGGGWACVR